LEEGVVDLFSKTVKEEGLEIDMEVGIIRFGSMVSWAGSRGRIATVRLRHSWSTATPTSPSSVLSSGMNSYLKWL
jgi:hypothetical protein